MTDCELATSLRNRLNAHYEATREKDRPFTWNQIRNRPWSIYDALIIGSPDGFHLEVRRALKGITAEEYHFIESNISAEAFNRLNLPKPEPEPEKLKPFLVVNKENCKLFIVYKTRTGEMGRMEYAFSVGTWFEASNYLRIRDASQKARDFLKCSFDSECFYQALRDGMEA